LRAIANEEHEVNFDLVILDVDLPEMDGNNLLTFLKTNETTKQIPVLVFNDSTFHKEIYTSYQLRANCFLKKPVELKDYIKTILSIKNFWMDSDIVALPGKI